MRSMTHCSICDKAVYLRGWCERHYRRWWEYGDPRHAHKNYRSLTAREKVAILKSNKPAIELAREYDVSYNTIRRYRQNAKTGRS